MRTDNGGTLRGTLCVLDARCRWAEVTVYCEDSNSSNNNYIQHIIDGLYRLCLSSCCYCYCCCCCCCYVTKSKRKTAVLLLRLRLRRFQRKTDTHKHGEASVRLWFIIPSSRVHPLFPPLFWRSDHIIQQRTTRLYIRGTTYLYHTWYNSTWT